MSTERKELIIDLAGILAPKPKTRRILHISEEREILIDAPKLADAILAAGYRKPQQVNTVEELDALIVESVVRSDAGIIYERYADEDGPEFDYWLIPGEPRAQASTKIDLPALVIFDPEPLS